MFSYLCTKISNITQYGTQPNESHSHPTAQPAIDSASVQDAC